MMIALRDLTRREYIDKQCVDFTYFLPVGDNAVEIRFSKIDGMVWSVFAMIRLNNAFGRVIYDGVIKQHAQSMKLEDICAQGILCILRAANDMQQMFANISYSAMKVVGEQNLQE